MAWTLKRQKWVIIPDVSELLKNKTVVEATADETKLVRICANAVKAEEGLLGIVYRLGPETVAPPSRAPVKLLEAGEVVVHLVNDRGETVGEVMVNAAQVQPVKYRASIPACRLLGAPDWKGVED
jgi:hypothetical protein